MLSSVYFSQRSGSFIIKNTLIKANASQTALAEGLAAVLKWPRCPWRAFKGPIRRARGLRATLSLPLNVSFHLRSIWEFCVWERVIPWIFLPSLGGGGAASWVMWPSHEWFSLAASPADLSTPGINAPGGSLLNQLHFIWNGVSLTFQLESREHWEMFPRLRRELGVAKKWSQSLAAPGLCSSGPEVRPYRRSSPTFIKNESHLSSSFHLIQND